ncbi:MAG: hypothetical protein H5U40_04215, partial [Polyangiaceae bacterium]|nr:hypothetical protein [Polyangiaceae bacterium]
VATRRLLFPARAEVTDALAQKFADARERLATLGFDVEPIGPRTLAIHRVPTALRNADPATALHTALTLVGLESDEQALCRGLATMLRPAAADSPEALSPEQAHELLDALDAARDGDVAIPSGSPIVRTYPLPETPRG